MAGTLPAAVAEALNLAPGTPVVYGGGDNQMSLLGNGLLSASSPALINIGTGAQVSQVTSQYARKPGVDTRSYFNGLYAFVGASMGGGRSYAALREALQSREGRDIGYREMDELASSSARRRGRAGVPRAALGARPAVPKGSSDVRNCRTSATRPGRSWRASCWISTGCVPRRWQTGPGSWSARGKGCRTARVWAQMAADVFDCPIKITNFENAVWGAALIAALGAGAISDPARGDLRRSSTAGSFCPTRRSAAQYRRPHR